MFETQKSPPLEFVMLYDRRALAEIFEYTYIMKMNAKATGLRGRGAAVAAMTLAAVVAAPASLARAAELVMFERAGCAWCARWDREVAPAYAKTAEGQRAPLRRHNLDKGQPQDIKLEAPVRFTPTFVLVDDGRETGRITGYIDNGMFWGMLSPMIAKLGASAKASNDTNGAAPGAGR